MGYAQTAAVGSVSLIGGTWYTKLSGKIERLSFDRKVCSLVGCLLALRCQVVTKVLFFGVLPRNHTIFGGPELFKISRAIDLSYSYQSSEYAWTRAVGQPKASSSRVVWAQPTY